MAAVTAGLMCPPLMWPKHCTMVAMLRPKHSEMRTRSGGGAFSSPAFHLMVEPRLRRMKMRVARYSPDTALQKALVQMPLKATMMLWQLQQCRNLLARRGNNFPLRRNIKDPFRTSGCTMHSLQNRSKWSCFSAHLSGLVKISVTAQSKDLGCSVHAVTSVSGWNSPETRTRSSSLTPWRVWCVLTHEFRRVIQPAETALPAWQPKSWGGCVGYLRGRCGRRACTSGAEGRSVRGMPATHCGAGSRTAALLSH